MSGRVRRKAASRGWPCGSEGTSRDYTRAAFRVHRQRLNLRFDAYLAEAAQGEVELTQDGKPWVVLHGVGDNSGVDSEVFARSEEFRRMMQARTQERGISWEEVKKQLGLDS